MKTELLIGRLSKILWHMLLATGRSTLLAGGFRTFFNVVEGILLVCTKKQTHDNYPLPDSSYAESYVRKRRLHATSTSNLQFAFILHH
jgi:hypothetical protein